MSSASDFFMRNVGNIQFTFYFIDYALLFHVGSIEIVDNGKRFFICAQNALFFHTHAIQFQVWGNKFDV